MLVHVGTPIFSLAFPVFQLFRYLQGEQPNVCLCMSGTVITVKILTVNLFLIVIK